METIVLHHSTLAMKGVVTELVTKEVAGTTAPPDQEHGPWDVVGQEVEWVTTRGQITGLTMEVTQANLSRDGRTHMQGSEDVPDTGQAPHLVTVRRIAF